MDEKGGEGPFRVFEFTGKSQENHRKINRYHIILPFRFFLIVRTIVPPSSIDSDQVIDRNTQNQKKN